MKYLLSFLLFPLFLISQTNTTKIAPPSPLLSEVKTPKDFSIYTTIGATSYASTIIKYRGKANELVGGDIGIGTRGTTGKHIWDGVIGLQGNRYFQGLYIQSSYLFYPLAPKGVYLGVGCNLAYGHTSYFRSAQTYSYYWKQRTFPFILGYHLQKSFVQLRIMTTSQIDFSYGFEF